MAHLEETDAGSSERITVFLRRVPGGPTTILQDSAALIWQCAAAGEEEVPKVIAESFGEPTEHVRQVVEDFLVDLVSKGFLEEMP